jgi:hypothetical protein
MRWITLSPEEIVSRVENAVAQLAWECETPDQVAEQLDKAGARGQRAEAMWCPLRYYLTAVTGYFPLLVEKNATLVGFGVEKPVILKHPDVLADFVKAFDYGAYPKLDMMALMPDSSMSARISTLTILPAEAVSSSFRRRDDQRIC